MNSGKWFWVWIVLATTKKKLLRKASARTEVWRNLVIIRARTPEEAYEKALQQGEAESGDSSGNLTLDGEPAVCRCLGISDMGLIHEELGDGAEILWQLRRCTQQTARKLVRRKRALLNAVSKEFEYAPEATVQESGGGGFGSN